MDSMLAETSRCDSASRDRITDGVILYRDEDRLAGITEQGRRFMISPSTMDRSTLLRHVWDQGDDECHLCLGGSDLAEWAAFDPGRACVWANFDPDHTCRYCKEVIRPTYIQRLVRIVVVRLGRPLWLHCLLRSSYRCLIPHSKHVVPFFFF